MNPILNDLFAYLNAGVSPFHAVEETAVRLEAAGFVRLEESRPWQLEQPGRAQARLLARRKGGLLGG